VELKTVKKYYFSKSTNIYFSIISVLTSLRGDDSAQYIADEMNEMAQEASNQGEEVSYRDLFTKKQLYKPLLCAVMVQISQQFSGINAV
jgi:hypothetical protein